MFAAIENIDPARHYKKFKILQKKISKTRDWQVQLKLLQKYRKPSGKAESIFFQWQINLNKSRRIRELELILKKKAANYLVIYEEICESLNRDNKAIRIIYEILYK